MNDINKYLGSEILIKSLLKENVKYIFGYPGGAVMPIYDAIYKYRNDISHILVRHEQGAIHAAQGYARVTGNVGVCCTTSGPGATNLITGLVDALIDSTPIVCVTGQVEASLLGSDAFQETNIIDLSISATKWNIQVTDIKKLSISIAKAFYIATTGRPGPVLIDITKDTQLKYEKFYYSKCCYINNFVKKNNINIDNQIIKLINSSKKPLVLAGQGVILSNAEKELKLFIEKCDIPIATTLLGLSCINKGHRLNFGMLGMHGNYAPNILTNKCDLLIAIGMRFDDRVTGKINNYAKQAKIVHIDIDSSEINKNVVCDYFLIGDCKLFLKKLVNLVDENKHDRWISLFNKLRNKEDNEVVKKDLYPEGDKISMGEVVACVNNFKKTDAILVTDVGQHQMIAARYYNFTKSKTNITSGGLGTMGFAIPASIGVQLGSLDKEVICIVGDGGFQMTLQELGTILQNNLPIKIIIMNNSFLGMVRQWQELFFDSRYSCTHLINPDFCKIADAYNISSTKVHKRNNLSEAVKKMFSIKHKPYLLNVIVDKTVNVFPMIPIGSSVSEIRLK